MRAQLTGVTRVGGVATDTVGSATVGPVAAGPVAVGTEGPVAVEADPDGVGTSSRGAATQTAVKARTLTPSLVRVNRWRTWASPIDP